MKRWFERALDTDARRLQVGLTALVFVAISIGASVWIGERLRRDAHDAWLSKGQTDAARMTESVQFWISKAEVNLRAMAGQFHGAASLDRESFFQLIEEAETWDPDVTFASVAYAQRVLRRQRAEYERRIGAPLSVVGKPDERAPEVFESFVVHLASREQIELRPNSDLTTHPAMRTVVTTARQTPGHVILGPAFVTESGDQHALIGTATDLVGGTGVMVATINLDEFFADFSTDYLPDGIHVRLVERDSEARERNLFMPIIGTLEPPAGVAATEIIRIISGQARWDLHWDILPGYLGGPADGLGLLVTIGGTSFSCLIAILLGYLSIQNSRMRRIAGSRRDQLTRDSALFQLTLDAIDQGIAVWDIDERLVLWNKRCLDFWQHSKDLVRTEMPREALRAHLVAEGVQGGEGLFGPGDYDAGRVTDGIGMVLTTTQGRRVQVHRFPLERGGHVEVYTDVTERERAREDLEASRDELERRIAERTQDLREARDNAVIASEAKSEFLANMSHELRTPLNAIIGFSQMSAAETYGPLGHEKYLEYVNIIAATGEHLLELISDILELSQIEANIVILNEEDVDVAAMIKTVAEIVSPQAGKAGVAISVMTEETPPRLHADGRRLRQMLLNLLDNAIKFSPEGSRVEVRSEVDSENAILVLVVDQGSGIPGSELDEMTEPFKRSNSNPLIHERPGAGLGLALVKYLVELHGGALLLRSQLGVGTTATLRFPPERLVPSPASEAVAKRG